MNRYLVGLGSNVRHVRHGAPERVLAAAISRLGKDLAITAVARAIRSDPLGPSRRRYANSAVLVEGTAAPEAMLDLLQAVEHEFGRRRRGQRWGARVLDLDLLMWDGGSWSSNRLTLPHHEMRNRPFVLIPACRIAPHWRDPLSNLTIRQLLARTQSTFSAQDRLTARKAPPRCCRGRALSSVGRATDF